MGRNRTVEATSDRIEISDGDWIKVKHELNVGDQKRLEACGLGAPMFIGGQVIRPIDWEIHDLQRALIWLTDWSISGPDGKTLELSFETLRVLDVDTFDEINKAIIKHRMEEAESKKAAREAAKTPVEKLPIPEPTVSAAIST